MRLLGVRLARAIWLLPPYFLNPKGIFLRPVVGAIQDRYGFLVNNFEKLNSENRPENEFRDGRFSTAKGEIQILSLKFHDDGIVVDTRTSTDAADAFLEDAVSWVATEHGLPSFTDVPIQRVYASELNVQFAKTPRFMNPKLDKFMSSVASAMNGEEGDSVGVLALHISGDQAQLRNPRVFRVEREINTRPEENRYYSFAPIQTTAHIQLLESLVSVT